MTVTHLSKREKFSSTGCAEASNTADLTSRERWYGGALLSV